MSSHLSNVSDDKILITVKETVSDVRMLLSITHLISSMNIRKSFTWKHEAAMMLIKFFRMAMGIPVNTEKMLINMGTMMTTQNSLRIHIEYFPQTSGILLPIM